MKNNEDVLGGKDGKRIDSAFESSKFRNSEFEILSVGSPDGAGESRKDNDDNDGHVSGIGDVVVVGKPMLLLSDKGANNGKVVEVDNDKFNSSLDEFLDESLNSSLDEPVESFALERVMTGIKINEDQAL